MTFRPALRPGALLLRRDAHHLQVGTSPGTVIVDRPGLMGFLRALNGIRDVPRLQALAESQLPELDANVPDLINELVAAGAIVDASCTGHAPHRRSRIGFHADHSVAPLVAAMRSVLADAGLRHLDAADPDLLLVVSPTEPAREFFERTTSHGTPHLPVVIDEDRVRIGPLVVPGHSPCLGCHDLHRADWDHAWPALVHQFGRTPPTPTGLAATTAHAAAVEVATDVLTHTAGQRAGTVGSCLVVGPAPDHRVSRPVAFHHKCGCHLLKPT